MAENHPMRKFVNLPDDLVEVCQDRGPSVWKYSASTDKYYRVYTDGNYTMISRKFLPDPEIAWANKIEMFKKKGERVNIEALKPEPSIFSLWEHANGICV